MSKHKNTDAVYDAKSLGTAKVLFLGLQHLFAMFGATVLVPVLTGLPVACGNDATMVQYCFGRGMIMDPHLRSLIDPVTFKASSDPAELFQLYRKEEIDELMADFSVERLHYVGTDMATNYMRETVDAMDIELFDLYLRYHFSICERADCVGASHHILDIFRKQ